MKSLFINPETKLLRAGWRILAFAIIFLAINACLMFTVRFILGSLKGGGLLWFTLLGLSATIAAYISRKYIDKESLTSLGLKFDRMALLDVLSGVVNSALVMACMYFTLLFMGLIKFKGFAWWGEGVDAESQFGSGAIIAALGVFWQFMIVAWWEEMVNRGILLKNIARGLNLKWAVIISSVIFALVHAWNPDASVLSISLLVVITFQLVYAYLKTGQLWLPMGLHLGWNFFQASVFGFASSGRKSPSLIEQEPIGTEWLSGGSFGAEGSLLIVPFVLASFLLIHWWVVNTRASGQPFFGVLLKLDGADHEKDLA